MSFDTLGVDSLLQVLAYSNVQVLARMTTCSRFGAVASHEAQQRPSLLVLKGTLDQVAVDLREKLAARPTLAFLQYSSVQGVSRGAEMLRFIKTKLPPETKVLGAQTNSLQCLLHRDSATPQQKGGTTLEIAGMQNGCEEEVGLLLATLPEAKAHTFLIEDFGKPGSGDDSEEGYSDDEYSDEEEGHEVEAGDAADTAVEATGGYSAAQPAAAPPAAGGGWLNTLEGSADAEMKDAEAGTAESSAPVPQPENDNSDRAVLARLKALQPPPEVIVVQLGGRGIRAVEDIQKAFPQAAVIGGVVMGQECIATSKTQASLGRGVGVMAITGNAPLFALTSPFTGSVKDANQDVQRKCARAQVLAAEQERRILGALLFTCNGRGARMFRREANDALVFQDQFPAAQLLGYYAGGEVGPEVRDDMEDSDAFLRGNARVQGFTAVFGFFLVPDKHAPSLQFQRAVLHGEVQEAFQELLRNQ